MILLLIYDSSAIFMYFKGSNRSYSETTEREERNAWCCQKISKGSERQTGFLEWFARGEKQQPKQEKCW